MLLKNASETAKSLDSLGREKSNSPATQKVVRQSCRKGPRTLTPSEVNRVAGTPSEEWFGFDCNKTPEQTPVMSSSPSERKEVAGAVSLTSEATLASPARGLTVVRPKTTDWRAKFWFRRGPAQFSATAGMRSASPFDRATVARRRRPGLACSRLSTPFDTPEERKHA